MAILLVLYGHVVFRMPDNAWGHPVLLAIRQLGVAGVDLFYVLSGFLVGGALLAEQKENGRVQLGRFFARRALRLWPSYFLLVLFAWKWFHWVTVPLADGSVARGTTLWGMWPYFLHLQNYYDLLRNNVGASAALQTWTLASIVHVYIFAALLVAGLGRRIHRLPLIVGGIGVICFLLRLRAAPASEEEFDAYLHYFPTHLRLDEPMFGMLLAYLVVHRRAALDRFMRRAWGLVLMVSVGLLIPLALRKEELPPSLCIWGYTAGALAAGGLTMSLWWLEDCNAFVVSPFKPLATVGTWSYSIYLWHQPLCTHLLEEKLRLFIGGHVTSWSSPLYYPVSSVASVAAAVAIGGMMYFVLERPSLVLRGALLDSKLADISGAAVALRNS